MDTEKKTGMQLIEQERHEQVYKHGFSLEHDAEYYQKGELIQAALFCQDQANKINGVGEKVKWPWTGEKGDLFADKIRKKDRIGQLKVAGAFYLAESERTSTDEYKYDIAQIAAQIDNILAGNE